MIPFFLKKKKEKKEKKNWKCKLYPLPPPPIETNGVV